MRFITVLCDQVMRIIPIMTAPATMTRIATDTINSSSEKPFWLLLSVPRFALRSAFTNPPQKGFDFKLVTVEFGVTLGPPTLVRDVTFTVICFKVVETSVINHVR